MNSNVQLNFLLIPMYVSIVKLSVISRIVNQQSIFLFKFLEIYHQIYRFVTLFQNAPSFHLRQAFFFDYQGLHVR